MKQVDMKQEPEKASADCCMPSKSDSPSYPYGLRINLDEKSLKKLGLKDMPEVGTTLQLDATVEVCDVSINDSASYGENRNLGLQIVSMGLEEGSEEGESK